jgi:hypothetical protein
VLDGAEVEPVVGTGVPSGSATGEPVGAAFGAVVVPEEGAGVP